MDTEHDPHGGLGVSSERVIEPHRDKLIQGADGQLEADMDAPASDVEGTGTKGTAHGHAHGTFDTSRITDPDA